MAELDHTRWLASQLTRDDENRMVVDEHRYAGAAKYIYDHIEPPETRDEFIAEVLRMAHGAFEQGGEVLLAQQLVKMLMLHPKGTAWLMRDHKSRASKILGTFEDSGSMSAPVIDKAAPAGSIKLSSFLKPGAADRRAALAGRKSPKKPLDRP